MIQILSNRYKGTNGTIEILEYDNNMNEEWSINTDCDQVHIYSEIMNIESGFDFLFIENCKPKTLVSHNNFSSQIRTRVTNLSILSLEKISKFSQGILKILVKVEINRFYQFEINKA